MNRSEYLKEWRKKNPDKVRQHKKNYYSKHKEHEREKASERYFRGLDQKYGLKMYYCMKCGKGVHWNHHHFSPPKQARYNHKCILPEYKEENDRLKKIEFEFMSKLSENIEKHFRKKLGS